MRTWSVRGTAFALCTRSSSLSISTSTSMEPESTDTRGAHSFLWRKRCAGASGGIELFEPLRDARWNEVGDVAAELCDLLDPARGDEAHLRARHHVDGLDVGGKRAVELVPLALPLEVGADAEAIH